MQQMIACKTRTYAQCCIYNLTILVLKRMRQRGKLCKCVVSAYLASLAHILLLCLQMCPCLPNVLIQTTCSDSAGLETCSQNTNAMPKGQATLTQTQACLLIECWLQQSDRRIDKFISIIDVLTTDAEGLTQ